jgi:hypothetical protein
LCQNEVEYFYKNDFHLKPEFEFFSDIQQRLLLHRVEELKIKNGKIKKGGFISVANGSRVQGTVHVNGLQPDYIVDSKSAEIQEYLQKVGELKDKNISIWDKIDGVGEILRSYIQRTEYDDAEYLKLLTQYREKNLEIPLSEYIKIGKGVCRESALLTILGLNSIGIESYYYYAKVSTQFADKPHEEDHAVVVVNVNDCFWVVDNYFKAFNKHKLEEIQSLEGVNCKGGLMYDNVEKVGKATIFMSRLYPETKHNSTYIK